MNEELVVMAQSALVTIINDVATVRSFAIEQAPDIIQQLLRWRFTVTLIAFCAGCLCLIAAVVSIDLLVRKSKKWLDDGSGIPLVLCGVIAIVGTASGIVSVAENLDWLQIIIAPKVYLLEYAAGLVNA